MKKLTVPQAVSELETLWVWEEQLNAERQELDAALCSPEQEQQWACSSSNFHRAVDSWWLVATAADRPVSKPARALLKKELTEIKNRTPYKQNTTLLTI